MCKQDLNDLTLREMMSLLDYMTGKNSLFNDDEKRLEPWIPLPKVVLETIKNKKAYDNFSLANELISRKIL